MTPRFSLLSACALTLTITLARTGSAAVLPTPEAPSAATSLPEPRMVEVTLGGSVTQQALLHAGLDIVNTREGALVILEWPGDERKLAALGATWRLIDATPGRTAARLAEAELASAPAPRAQTQSLNSARAVAAPPFGAGSMGGYWTTAEIKQRLDELVAGDTQDIVADKIDTVGYSVQGRPIWGLQLGKRVTGTDTRPVAFYNSLTHAREPGGMQSMLYFAADLLPRYGTDPFVTYLLDKRRIYLVPLVNPDGYRVNELTYTNTASFGLWRKNARDNNGNGSFAADSDGVDLNRNYGFKWGFDNTGSSPDMTTETYRGPAAFSEPESQVQRDLVTALQPVTGLSFHSFSDLLLHPWGYTNSQPVDAAAFHEWNDLLTRDNAYQTGQSGPLLYNVNGDFNDWCYGDTTAKARAFTWTPEIGNDTDFFWPPPSRIVPLAQSTLRTSYMVAAIAGAFVQQDGWTIAEGNLNASYGAHVSVRARNLGAGAAAGPGLTGTLTPLDPGVRMLVSTIAYPTLTSRTSGNPLGGATFEMVVNDTVTAGRLVRFQIQFGDASGLVSRDTLSIPLGTPTVLAFDNASSGMTNWTVSPANTWGVVQNDPQHLSNYFADSPSGNYSIGSAATMTLVAPLNMTSGLHAFAVYESRWDIQRDYDAGVVEASLNGSTWTNIRAPGSSPGSGFGVQTLGRYFYQGTRWGWRTEWADLSAYTGSAGSAVRLRFRLRSDGNSNYDGLSLDSLRVLLFDPAAQPALVAVGPPAAAGTLDLSSPWPNPARRLARFEFALPERAEASLVVLDLQGRLVRTLSSGITAGGGYARQWDMNDASGRRVNAGVYFVRLATPQRQLTRRLVVMP